MSFIKGNTVIYLLLIKTLNLYEESLVTYVTDCNIGYQAFLLQFFPSPLL